MRHERLIPEPTLAKLWRIHPVTPYYWRQKGRITSDEQERMPKGRRDSHFYRLSSIDAYHAAPTCAVGFEPGTIPSASKLLEDDPGLLTIPEAATLLGKSKAVVYRRVKQGDLPALLLVPGEVVRFPARLLARIARDNSLVHPHIAARVLCQSTDTVFALVAAGRLRTAHERGNAKQVYIVRDSLLLLLADLLPGFIQPEAWWQESLAHDQPALSRKRVMQRYHIGQEVLQRYLDEGKLPYIRTPGATERQHIRMPARAVHDLLMGQLPLDAIELAGIFPVSVDTAAWWIARRALCQQVHGGGLCPMRQCVDEYILANRTTDDLTPMAWLQQWQLDRLAPINSEELVNTTVGTTEADIYESVANGQLRGVWLPPDPEGVRHLAVFRTDAVVWRRMHERRLYRDYHRHLDEM